MRYSTIAKVYDLGPFIYKVVLDLNGAVIECNIPTDLFHVHTVRKDIKSGEIIKVHKEWGSEETYPSEGERKVIAAYVSDKDGNKV
ncbi:MAG: hypothetical protein EWM47_09160, partial [Anaerolineaceae bacterium]